MSKLSLPAALLATALGAGLVVAGVQDGKETAKPARLPDSPVFKEPGWTFKAGEELFKPREKGRNLWLAVNPKGRQVIVRGSVCRDRAALEEFLCLKQSKEHESIVAADIDARTLHAMLILTGAEAGRPAVFTPKFQPPTGDRIEITIEWKQGKESKRAKAQDWIRDFKTQKAIDHPFVFAGSQEIKNPVTGEIYYLGNDGDIISVANFSGSIIDIAAESSETDAAHLFEAYTERIPPVDTEVFVILKPVPKADKPKPATEPAKSEKPAKSCRAVP